jgi:predicted ATPase
LSDGTIRFITLLAILLRPGVAPLICLEEPELGLHPDALTLIAKLLVEASEQTQIIVTTQSDILVSALSEHAESVVVCENLGGASRFRRLESDKLRFWMDKYKLGEIWRIGELGGNP